MGHATPAGDLDGLWERVSDLGSVVREALSPAALGREAMALLATLTLQRCGPDGRTRRSAAAWDILAPAVGRR